MRGGKPESFGAISARAMKNIKRLAFPSGAVLTCPVCLRRSEKTPEEMEKYLNKWPYCCDVPASVKPK